LTLQVPHFLLFLQYLQFLQSSIDLQARHGLEPTHFLFPSLAAAAPENIEKQQINGIIQFIRSFIIVLPCALLPCIIK